MIRASDLIGCELRTQAGKRLGRVHDLRARSIANGWELEGLVIGRAGMATRLIGDNGPEPTVRGEVIPWHSVTGIEDGLITVQDAQHSKRVVGTSER
jgi:sporulation protein YlmC with PRC-barrel domain